MVTLVGKQEDFGEALKALIELDFDAIEAYKVALKNLEQQNEVIVSGFKQDHERHVRELSKLLADHGIEAPNGPDLKQLLTKGKVFLANLMGEKAIFGAMLSNEEETNIAYERLNRHPGKWADAVDILERGWDDEIRHRDWFTSQINR